MRSFRPLTLKVPKLKLKEPNFLLHLKAPSPILPVFHQQSLGDN